MAQSRIKHLEPRLLVHVPGTRHIPCGQPARAACLAQPVGTLIAVGTVDGIATFPRIGGVGKECRTARVGVAERIVVGSLFLSFLEHLIGVVGNLTHLILHAPAAEPCLVTVVAVGLHTTVEVDDMVFGNHVVVGHRRTEVPAKEAVVAALVDTAVGQHCHGECIDIVGVGIEEGVAVADSRGTHRTIGHSLVRLVEDAVLIGGGRVLHSTQYRHLHLADRLVGELALGTEVDHAQVHEVALQLVQDVEGGIVARVERIGIKTARGVECIRVGVDIEVTLHLTAHGIHTLAQRTRSPLLAIRGIADHVDTQLLGDIECGVDIGRIALHLALYAPARVEHGTQRGVSLATLGTRRDADRVVVHHRRLEQLAKPVGIAILGIAQIGSLGLRRVGQGKLAGHGIILAQHLVHLAKDTRVGSIGSAGIEQVAFLLQLLIHGHLVLRVHDVEIVVARDESHGELSRIVDVCLTGLTALGGHHNHTCHGTRTIDRGG